MQISLTLTECRKLYENHFKKDLPGNLPYHNAAVMVLKDVGEKKFKKMVEKVKK